MRKTVLFLLGTMLMAGSAVQVATASGHQARETDQRHYRGAYDQWNGSSYIAPLTIEEERNKEGFGFSGRDASRPGGEDPSLNPPGN
jgi:hypothetical protein